jgi:hypothetical protein
LVLIPESKTSEFAVLTSRQISNIGTYVLDTSKNLPHITVHTFLSKCTKDLPKLLNLVNKPPILESLRYTVGKRGHLKVSYFKSPELTDFRKSLLSRLSNYKDLCSVPTSPTDSSLKNFEVESTEEHDHPYVFSPHLTLTKLKCVDDPLPLSSLPDPFKFSVKNPKLAVFITNHKGIRIEIL